MKKLLLALFLVSATAQAQSPVSDGEKRRIESIVREYLLKNPEVLQEALTNLEKKQAEAEEKAKTEAVLTQREAIYRNPQDIVLGNPKGDITLVEFFDYNCGYCKKAMVDVQALVKSDGNIRLIQKDMPVLGQGSVEAARVATAYRMQATPDKYQEFHTKLLGGRGQANLDRALAVAKEVGADITRLELDMKKPQVVDILQGNLKLADSLKITGTPSYVYGDEVLVGASSLETLKAKTIEVRQTCKDKAKC
jgi:protein-disulfide isomerase